YSLGCILYQLLVGEVPYPESATTSKLLAHRIKPIPSLCQRRPDVPQQLEEVFRRMVAKTASNRFASMSDVYRALANCHAPSAAAELASLAQSISANNIPDGANIADLLDDAALVLPAASEIGLSPVDALPARTLEMGRSAATRSRAPSGAITFIQRNVRIWAATIVGMLIIIFGAIGVRIFLDQGAAPQPHTLDQELVQRPPADATANRPAAVAQTPMLQAPVIVEQSPPTVHPTLEVQAASAEHAIAPAVVEPPMLKPVTPVQTPFVARSQLAPSGMVTGDDWFDFLPMIDLERDPPRRGKWARQPDGLHYTGTGTPNKISQLPLPLELTGSYQFQIEFSTEGGLGPLLAFPVGNDWVRLTLDIGNNQAHISGLEKVNGQSATATSNPAATILEIRATQRYRLDIVVKTTDDAAEINVQMDGNRLIQWQGSSHELSMNFPKQMPGAPVLSFLGSKVPFVIYTAKMQSLEGGRVTLLHQPPKGIHVPNYANLSNVSGGSSEQPDLRKSAAAQN
ncbi:MAG TPA: hypothetical protein VGI75_12320, partial [Pirellulales bacterium]